MRQLPDRSTLAGFMSVIFLARQRFIWIPTAFISIGLSLLILISWIVSRKGAIGDVFTLIAFTPLVGVGFSVLTTLPGFLILRAFRSKPTFSLEPGEAIVQEAPANHMLRHEGRGGRLVITNRRIVFLPHRFNVQLDVIARPFSDVTDIAWARVINRYGLEMSQCLEVGTSGGTECFYTFDAVTLGALIERAAGARSG
jgi:hypothetical protein